MNVYAKKEKKKKDSNNDDYSIQFILYFYIILLWQLLYKCINFGLYWKIKLIITNNRKKIYNIIC